MNEETQMVLLEYRDYARLKANSDKYMKNKHSSDCCSSCKNASKKTLKNSPSVTKEGYGEIKVPVELPSKFIDKPDIYVGATPEQLQREAGTSSSKETDSKVDSNNSSKLNTDSEVGSNTSSTVVSTDSSDHTPWYYIGKE